MKQKRISFFLCAALLFSLTACGSSGSGENVRQPVAAPEESQPVQNQNQDQDGQAPETPEETRTPAPETASEQKPVTISETVLLNQDGITITAKELVVDDIWGPGIKLLVENHSERNVSVSADSLSVNSYMMYCDLFSASVAAGKKVNETLWLSESDLREAGIETIADVMVSFRAYDSDSYDDLFTTDEIQIKTSAYGTVEQPAMDNGLELFRQDGIRVVALFLNSDGIFGADVCLYLENCSGREITVDCDDMSVNGFMVTPYFRCKLKDGRRALDEITILSADLEKNEIESVKDIELKFHVVDSNTYKTILDTETIRFSVE